MLKLVGEHSVKEFMEKHKMKHRGETCMKCGKVADYNECFYMSGYAVVQFQHECDPKYWVSKLVPISKKEKDFWFGVAKDL